MYVKVKHQEEQDSKSGSDKTEDGTTDESNQFDDLKKIDGIDTCFLLLMLCYLKLFLKFSIATATTGVVTIK